MREVATQTREGAFSDYLGRKQPTLSSRHPLPGSTDASREWVLWTVSDLDAELNLHAGSVEATIAPAPIGEAATREGLRGWGAGWEVQHGRHRDEVLICMTDAEPGQMYLRINDHVISVGVAPGCDLRSTSVTDRALADLSTAFRERLLATVLLAFEIVVSAPTILSISTAF
jgi:hypothetical protein